MKRYHPRLIFGLFLAALAGFHPLPVSGAPGDPDNSFAQQGVIDEPITAVAVDLFGNIWIGGRFLHVYGQTYAYLAVLHPDGTLNTQFTSGSLASIGVVHAIDVDDTGNVYVGGQNGMGRLNYVPNNQSWTVDTAFTTQASKVFRRCDSIAVDRGFNQPAQTIFGAGSVNYTNSNNTVVGNVACLHNNGTLDPSFNMPSSYASDQVIQIHYLPPCACGPNTISFPYLLLAGSFGALVLQGNGDIQNAYADYILSSCAALRSQGAQYNCSSSHGEMIRGGFFNASYFANSDQFTPFHLERLGGSDPGWFHNINGYQAGVNNGYSIAAIDALDGGDLVVAGFFSQIGGNYVNNFAHLLPDGSVDQSFNNNAGYPVFVMAKQPDGKYILAGETGYTPEGGIISRRFGVPAPRPVTFAPPPSGQSVFAGDSACLSAGVDAWPTPQLMWFKNGSPLTNQTGAGICLYSVTANDDADYFLRATTFCGSPGYSDSATAHLTVLPAPAPPPNDMFGNAFTLTGASAIGVSYIRSATVEPGEVNNGPSVWWTWTAPSSGLVTLDVSGCDFSAYVAIYTGTDVASLAFVNDNCNFVSDGEGGGYCNGYLTQTNFFATSGTTYKIAVSGAPRSGSPGNVIVRLNPITIIPASLTLSNGFNFQITGPSTGFAVVETTLSLRPANWQPLATNPFVNGTATFSDPRPHTNPASFYRIRLQ